MPKHFYAILRDTVHIDTYDLNYGLCSERLSEFFKNGYIGNPRKGIFLRVAAFCVHLLKSLPDVGLLLKRECRPLDVVYVSSTKNQDAAIEPLVDAGGRQAILGTHGHGSLRFPMGLAYAASLFFLPVFAYRYATSSPYQQSLYGYTLDLHLLGYGYYATWRVLLRRMKPSLVVISNDHFLWSRTVLFACKAEGVKCSYVQHACVSDRFPRLEMDYAFLDGKDALVKYASIGVSNTKVFLTGSPKYDCYAQYQNNNATIASIGIAVSKSDDIRRAEELLLALTGECPKCRVALRSHPGDPRYASWTSLAQRTGANFSDSRHEDVAAFLGSVDLLIAGESSISLEAVLANVYPVYYRFSGTVIDNYDFIKNGLVTEVFASPDAVIAWLRDVQFQKRDTLDRAQYYNAVIMTPYHHRSTALVREMIKELVASQINLARWKKIDYVETIEAYELRQTGTL